MLEIAVVVILWIGHHNDRKFSTRKSFVSQPAAAASNPNPNPTSTSTKMTTNETLSGVRARERPTLLQVNLQLGSSAPSKELELWAEAREVADRVEAARARRARLSSGLASLPFFERNFLAALDSAIDFGAPQLSNN